MPRSLPSYRKHSSREIAFIEVAGKRHYLPGEHNSPESLAAYGKAIAKLSQAGAAAFNATAEAVAVEKSRPAPMSKTAHGALLGEIALAWLNAIEKHEPNEYGRAKSVIQMLSKEDASKPADFFKPSRLILTRDRMIEKGWSRSYINDQVQRLRRMIRWAAERDLCDGSTWTNLSAVAGLRRGKTAAPEPRNVLPAPIWSVGRAMKHASLTVATMIRVQYRTGMRSHHLCAMRPMDIDFTSHEDVWVYTPLRHEKGRAKELKIMIGPRAQKALAPLMDREPDQYFFSPRESCLQYGRKPQKSVRDHFDRSSYRRAVERCCKKAGVPHFYPHRLRHSAATNTRDHEGLEAAQAILGHDNMDVTQIYAEKDMKKAVAAARRIG